MEATRTLVTTGGAARSVVLITHAEKVSKKELENYDLKVRLTVGEFKQTVHF